LIEKISTSIPNKVEDDTVKYNFYVSAIKILGIMGFEYGPSKKYRETKRNSIKANNNGTTCNSKQILQLGQYNTL